MLENDQRHKEDIGDTYQADVVEQLITELQNYKLNRLTHQLKAFNLLVEKLQFDTTSCAIPGHLLIAS